MSGPGPLLNDGLCSAKCLNPPPESLSESSKRRDGRWRARRSSSAGNHGRRPATPPVKIAKNATQRLATLQRAPWRAAMRSWESIWTRRVNVHASAVHIFNPPAKLKRFFMVTREIYQLPGGTLLFFLGFRHLLLFVSSMAWILWYDIAEYTVPRVTVSCVETSWVCRQ